MITATADKTEENPMRKFDAPVLRAIETATLERAPAAFLPRNMAEAMELAKIMAASRFVPPHLRQQAGDCLAVVMFAQRVEADPFAVASKTYFVNDRMAFEAQLVMALVNTRAPLAGRLDISWTGEGNSLVCRVAGKLRGDEREKIVTQEIATITTKNSPLWKTSPRQQLGYLTARMWARLHCPEVLLGVYTPDEIQDMGELERRDDGSYGPPPPRPQRADFVKAEPTEDPEWKIYNYSGEIVTRFKEADAFADGLIAYMQTQCPDGRSLEACEEYHREQVNDLSDDLKAAIADTYDACLRKIPNRTA